MRMRFTVILMTVIIALMFAYTGSLVLAATPINMWISSQPATVGQWLPQFEKAFNDANPDIELKVSVFNAVSEIRDKLVIAIAGGAAPDLFYDSSNVTAMWANSGAALPLDNYINAMPDRKDFIPDVLNAMRYNGHIYAFPFSVAPTGDVYNLDLIAQNGIGTINSWSEMITAIGKITRVNSAGKIDVYGYGKTLSNIYAFIDLELAMNQLGETMLKPEAKEAHLLTDAARQALAYLTDICTYGMRNQKPTSTALAEGKVAVMHMYDGNSMIKVADTAKNINFSFRPYVGPEKDKKTIHFNAGTFFIVSTTKSPDKAWKVLETFIQPNNMKDYMLAHGATIPSRISLLNDSNLQKGNIYREMVSSLSEPMVPYGPMHPYYTDVRAPGGDYLIKAVTGQMPPNIALEEAERTINRIIGEKEAANNAKK